MGEVPIYVCFRTHSFELHLIRKEEKDLKGCGPLWDKKQKLNQNQIKSH